ncbi:MAG: quinoprotein relay system zinc metallohydrolase 2 [Granulosicoccus sp.]|nr:quinoprotein relay system zinc metallohydrolase 2 [Granulosicoccus sp.]
MKPTDPSCRRQAFRMVWQLVCLLAILSPLQTTIADPAGFSLISPAPGVYLHTGRHEDSGPENEGDIANVGFIVGENSVLVIDPGGSPRLGRMLLNAIRETTELPISHTVLTHIHPDHILGSQVFAHTGELVAHKRYPAALAQRGQFYLDRFAYLFEEEEKQLPAPTVLVDGTLEVDLGNRPVIIRAHPTAHTDHDLSIHDVTTQTLWASDLVFAERIPSLDGSISGWHQETKLLLTEDIKLIIPGHGAPAPAGVILLPQLRYLTRLLTEVREKVADNTRLADAVEMVAKDEKSHWLLFDLYHAGNITKAYTELEWE